MNSVQILFGMLLTLSLMLCSCEKESLSEDLLLLPPLEAVESASLQAGSTSDTPSMMAISRSGEIVIMDEIMGLTTEEEDNDD